MENAMYNVEEKDDYSIYTFNGIDLRIKCAENKDSVNVYIDYNGYNPLFSMLIGDFEAECKLDSISFETKTNSDGMYAIVSKEQLTGFIKEIYFFIMENRSVLIKNIYQKND